MGNKQVFNFKCTNFQSQTLEKDKTLMKAVSTYICAFISKIKKDLFKFTMSYI